MSRKQQQEGRAGQGPRERTREERLDVILVGAEGQPSDAHHAVAARQVGCHVGRRLAGRRLQDGLCLAVGHLVH